MELNELYSQKFEQQLTYLITGFSKASTNLTAMAGELQKLDVQIKTIEQSEMNLLKAQKQAEEIRIKSTKAEQEAIKVEKEAEKLLQEKEKTAQARTKTEKERYDLAVKQQKQAEQRQKQIQKEKTEQVNLIKLLQEEVKTEKQALEQNKKLRAIRADLDATTAKGAKQLKLINKQIDSNTELIRNNADAQKKQQMNIGNYKDALSGVSTELMNGNITIKEATKQVGGMTKAFIKFLSNPIVLTVMAIVGALALMTKAIMDSKIAQDKLRVAMAEAETEWKVLLGALRNIGNGGFKNFSKNVIEADAATRKFVQASIALEREMREENVSFNKMNNLAEKNRKIADDATKSFKEREEAAKEAMRIDEERLKGQFENTDAEMVNYREFLQSKKATGQEIQGDEFQKLAELRIARQNAWAEWKNAEYDNAKAIREIRLDDFEQQLDYLFDVSDKKKTANEKLIADEKLTFEERQKILDETNRLLDESFSQQIKLFNDTHDIQIDTNKLLSLNNNESYEYAKSLGMGERATNRLLEVIRERIAATSDMNEAQKAINKSEMEYLNKQVEETQKIIDEIKNLYKTKKDEFKSFEEAMKEVNDEIENDILEGINKEDKAREQAHNKEMTRREQWKQGLQQMYGMAVEFGNVLFEMNQEQLNQQATAIEENYEKETALAGDNEAAKRAADRKYAIEKAKIDRQIAISQRNQALFNIATSTAMGIVSAWTLTPANPVLSGILTAFITSLGTIQAAAVSNKELPKIPSYDSGTGSLPSGLVEIAEKRPEIVFPKHGKPFLQKKRLVTDKLTGAAVLGGADTELLSSYSGKLGYDDPTMALEKGFKSMVNHIDNIRIDIGVDKHGYSYMIKNRMNKIRKSNYYR